MLFHSKLVLVKEAALSTELLKLIFQSSGCQHMWLLVQKAMEVRLPQILLDDVLSASPDALSEVDRH